MKYLTDKEILNWNKRLEDSGYFVYPISNNRSGYPDIVFRKKFDPYYNPTGLDQQFVETMDPGINYDFTFSISSNRKSDFFDLFENLSKEEFGTKSTYIKDNTNERSLFNIEFSDNIITSREESKHKIYDKEYVRFTYHFSGKLGSIMAYISYLEDTINYISEIWGYDENGSEVCLLKYPIGTIVSLKDDKSRNYLVLDYKYKKWDNKYTIDFVISEMLSDKSTIIKYGKVITESEEFLCYSRDSRIDDILN